MGNLIDLTVIGAALAAVCSAIALTRIIDNTSHIDDGIRRRAQTLSVVYLIAIIVCMVAIAVTLTV